MTSIEQRVVTLATSLVLLGLGSARLEPTATAASPGRDDAATTAPSSATTDALSGAFTTLSADSGGGPARIGQPHPALELDVLDGTLLSQRRLLGRPFVIDFFATWCQPCHRALADLLAARATTRDGRGDGDGPFLVLVDVGESREVVARWATQAALPADVIVTLDPTSVAARRWGTRRLPTTYLVDGDGNVRHINRGWGSGYRARMTRWLRDLVPARRGAGVTQPEPPALPVPAEGRGTPPPQAPLR